MSPRARKSDRRELPEFGAARGWARHRPRNRLSDTARRCKTTPFPSTLPFAARPLMADYVLVAFSPRCSVTAIGLCPDPSTVCVHVHRLERQTALTVRETGYEEQLSRQIESGRPELRNRACIRSGAKRVRIRTPAPPATTPAPCCARPATSPTSFYHCYAFQVFRWLTAA